MGFKNFSMWRGRLPHWRADDVVYYLTFRHRRPLTEPECALLASTILRGDGRKITLDLLCVLPETTEMIFRDQSGHGKDFSDFIERAKTKAGRRIVQKSGERVPPFYVESFDRIIRDENEYEELWLRILESPMTSEVSEDSDAWPGFWLNPDAGPQPEP